MAQQNSLTHENAEWCTHDAASIAHLAPVGMIFVPSVGGISHSEKEYTRPEDIQNGAQVLLDALVDLLTVEN